ncbi:hypothetical protein Ccar_16195 [Clostridium carboxidivorans P7]|uniref:HTH cro/C1-type domain-containing protein n=1 Tax=Clostridium carboxidivorans P7 TaxID=536227 RepID=C6Q138_9CLOT|nr:hypothetical protein [Clostridium carboxidivorans]AKN32319.1 hypothetical protein Ccar_16195 [Clostridium carboxidivorans P7]EET84774.1 hypothetical protein CcarbDRAFT_4755 [Clostridium carboxidivorans P7]
MENEVVRKKLKEYLEINGVRNNWIAKKINISPTSICLFLKDARNLSSDKLELIWNLIKE